MSGKNLPGGLIRIRDNEDGTQSYIFDKFCIFTKGYMTALNDKVPKPSIEGHLGIYLPVYSYGNMIKPAVGPEIENTELFATYDGNGHYSVITQDPISGPMNTLILSDVGGSDWFVFQNLAQTLTNKTLTSPTLSAPVFSGIGSGTIQSSSQPLFDVGLNASVTGVTGSGTKYNVLFNSINNIIGSGTFDTTTGGYTVAVPGYYHISTFLEFGGITSSNTDFQILINVSGSYYYTIIEVGNIAGSGGLLTLSGSMDRQCAVGDVIYLSVQVSGNTANNVSVNAGSGQTRFWGYMITPTP